MTPNATRSASPSPVTQVQPYLFFEGRCEEAIEFYKSILGVTVEMMMRFSESPVPPAPGMTPPNSGNKIMHSSFRVGSQVINASDGNCGGKAKFEGMSLSLTVRSKADAEQIFQSLSDGGQVDMPLSETFFSPSFGMLHDKFGVAWMVIVEKA